MQTSQNPELNTLEQKNKEKIDINPININQLKLKADLFRMLESEKKKVLNQKEEVKNERNRRNKLLNQNKS